MEEIKYRSAFDEIGNLVDINDVSNEDRKHEYHCISCGKQLVPRLGDIRRHHFYHKEDTVCKGETYLHELAKLRLKEKFDKSDHFYISYNAEVGCNQKCHADCKVNEKITEDLKLDYDTATIEKSVNEYESSKKYRADVLLTNSKDESKPPILLEIWVTSECKQEKKESDLRIIEIHIKEENDINSLYENEIIEETEGKISFHSFCQKKNLSSEDYSSEIFCYKLANLRLKKKFEESPHFYISYKYKIVCDREDCKLRSSACEQSGVYEYLDLKELNYTADISDINGTEGVLLTNGKSSILLVLNHKQTFCQKNFSSVSQVIEFNIKDEKDFKFLLLQDTIKESHDKIIFHSFNQIIKKKLSVTILRYVLSYNEFKVIPIPCDKKNIKLHSKSILELNTLDYVYENINALLYWAYENKGIKSCNICSHFDKFDRMCTQRQEIYKKKNFYLWEARNCQQFEKYNIGECKFEAEDVDPIKTEFKVIIKNEAKVDYETFRSKCDEFLKSELKENNVILVCNMDPICKRYAKERSLEIKNPEVTQNLFATEEENIQQILAEGNVAIVFWNGEDSLVAKFIEEAKKKEIEYFEMNLKIND